jgi:hypothetical protein
MEDKRDNGVTPLGAQAHNYICVFCGDFFVNLL